MMATRTRALAKGSMDTSYRSPLEDWRHDLRVWSSTSALPPGRGRHKESRVWRFGGVEFCFRSDSTDCRTGRMQHDTAVAHCHAGLWIRRQRDRQAI